MNFLHWNVHSWRDANGTESFEPITELIAALNPDVVSLVEVDEPWGRPARLQSLAEQLGYGWVFCPAFEYRMAGGFGNALLSRTTIRACQQWQLLSPRVYDGTEPTEPRAAVMALVDTERSPLWLGSTHLPRRDSDERQSAAVRLGRLLGGLSEPWAVCGDFNQPVWDWPEGSGVAPCPPVPTHPAHLPVEALDYVVFRGCAVMAEAVAADASDHLPIVGTIHLDSTGS